MSQQREGGCETEAEHRKDAKQDRPYSVNLWGSKPHTDDDCHTGDDFETEAEARKAYDYPYTHFKGPQGMSGEDYYGGDELWVELVGPGVSEERQLVKGRMKRKDDDVDWRREQAMQAGMAGGCDAYNEAMGYDNEEPWGETGSAF